jgi:hypothetical protein
LSLESVDDIERSDSLALGVLSVGDGVTDDTLQEGLQDTTSLLVDHGGDTLDTATAGQTTDSGLRDTLDVVTQDLAVALGTTLAETLSTFATCRADASVGVLTKRNRTRHTCQRGRLQYQGSNLRPVMLSEEGCYLKI